MIPARHDVARALETLASENLALRLELAMNDLAKARQPGPALPKPLHHAHEWTQAPRQISEAGFARDAM